MGARSYSDDSEKSWPPLSEDSIARSFSRQYTGRLRFDHDVGAWFEWSGNSWKMVRDKRVFDYAREVARQMSGGKRFICKASTISGIERLATADRRHRVTSDAWDQDKWLLGTPRGTVDLRTGKIHAGRAVEGITKTTSCGPGKGRAERWLQFLGESTGGDMMMIEYLRRIFGYCLTGDTSEHALFFLYGPGGNGKSVLLNILAYILGDYSAHAPMETFTKSKLSSHPADLAMLRGARMVVASETEEGIPWAEARIKSLTGGDPITARFMRQNFFTFSPQFKLLIAGNHQPVVQSADTALRRRFNILGFTHQPPTPDLQLEDKLKAEAPQILTWAIRGCLEWQRIGLATPGAVISATSEYFDEQDTFAQWLGERCEVGASKFDWTKDLFHSWSDFAREIGEDPGSQVRFSGRLKKAGMRRDKRGGVRCYNGLQLRRADREGQDESA